MKKPAAKAKGAVVEGYLEGADRDYYKRTSWLGEGEDVEQALAAAREKGMLPERITVDGKTLIVSEALRQQLHRRDPTLPASVLRKRLEADLRKQFGAPEPTEQPVHEAAESPEGHRLLEVSDPEGQVIGQIDVATAQETAADPAGNLRRILNKAAGREAITPGETMLRVHGLTVNKTSRRQGIGRRLVLQAAKDVSPGWLWSSQLGFPGQRAAVKLFEALEEAGEIEMLWGPGTHGNAVWAARIAQVAARPVSAYTARKVAAALKRKAITPEQAARIEEADRVAHHYGLDWRPLIFGTERVAFDPAAAEADTAQGRILREHIAAGLGFDYKTEEGRRATDERIRHAREKGTEFVLHGVTLPHRAGRGGPGDRAYSGLFASQGDATAGHEVGHGLWQAGYRAEAAPATEEAFAEWFAAEVVAGRLPQLTRGEGQGTAAPGLEMVEQPIQPGDIARFIHRNLPSLAGEDIPAGQTAPLKAFRKKFRDYLAGAKDVVATGEELVKYAEQRLPRGSRLPTGDVLRLAKRIARARTTGPAASPKMNRPIRQAVALIHYLADKADRLEALGETRKLLTKISKRAKGRPRKRGLQRELAPAVADVLGMLPQNQRVSTLAARVRRIADEMGLLQEVSETQQLGIDWQDPLVAPTAKAIVGNLASKLAELREPPERMADLPGNAVREINAALAQLLRLSETQKMLHLMDARLEKGTLLQDAVTVVLANRTSLPEHRRKAGREIARELLALKPLNLPRLIEKLTQGRRDTVLYDIGVYDPVDGLNQYARLLLDADDGLVAGIPAEGLDLDKVFSGWRRHWGYSRSGRPPKSSILPVAVKGAYRTENRADPRTGKVRLGLRVPVATLELSRAEWATVYAMTLDPHVSDELHRGSHAGIHLPRWNVGPVKIPNAEFNQIIEALPEDIRQMGRAYSRVFNGELGKAAIARGIELGDRGEPRGFAAGDTYTPTERYKEQVRSITPQQMLQPRAPRTLTNQPHLHERVQKSDAAYEIRPIHEVYSRWAEQMAAYAGLEKPARNLAWLLQQEDFRNAIKQSFPNGRQIVRYLIQRTQYFRHTLDLGEPSVMTRIVTWPLRMSVRAALPLRLRIGGYQFLSILNTIARDGLKSAATGVARMAAHGSQVRAQIAEEAPLLELRRRQTGARAISPLMISKAGRQRATGRRSKLDTFMWGLIRSVDIATTGSTYAAARQRHSGTERKAILSAIIDTGMTQPMWDPVFINGFGMMAHNSFWDAIMSRFQTQKWQNYGTFLGKFNALAGAQRDLRRAEAEGDAERVKIARQRVAAATRDLVKALFLIGVLGAVGLATIAAIDRKIAGTAHQPIQTIIGETALRRMLQNAGVPGEAVGFLVDVWRRGAKGRPLEAFGQTAKDVRLLVDMVADMVKAGDEVIKTGRNAGRTRAEVAVRAFLLRGAPLLARVFGIPLDAAKQYATRLLELIDRPSDLHFGQRLNGLTGKRPDKLSDEYQQRLWEELQRWGVSYKQAKQHLCKRLKIRALSARRSSRLRRFWKAMGGDLGE